MLGWCRSNPNATVAESREAAKLIMEGYMQSYDGLASAFAARWYDHQAESNGINLQNAVTASVYTPKKTDSVARYQVRKLMREGPSAFAKACGEYARNDALRALNETIIANVGRDKKKGVRFARVPTGRETCTFCIMLASRGAVYHTRKSAGEFKHFHRHCDCKVVPGFEDDPDAELVEGYKPKELKQMWITLKEVDSQESLTPAQKASLKRIVVRESPVDDTDWRELLRRRTVDMGNVRSKVYRSKLKKSFGGSLPNTASDDVARILLHRNGTDYEDLYAYDVTDGARIGSVVTSVTPKRVNSSAEMSAAIAEAVSKGHNVAMLHNHPDSGKPSAADFASLVATKASFGIIVCHDGSIYRYELVNGRYDGYDKDAFMKICELALTSYSSRIANGKSESAAAAAMENDWSLRIEHLL